MAQNRYRIRVEGALALGLYVSRALGAAPLVFEPRQIRISHVLSVVGRVFYTITWFLVVIDAYYAVFVLNPKITWLSRMFWALITGGVLVTNVIAVYTAESRMHSYLYNLQCLNQINVNMTIRVKVRKRRRKCDKIIKYYIVIFSLAYIASHSSYLIYGIDLIRGNMIYWYIFQEIAHCSERMVLTVLTMQFTLVTLQVLYTLQNVNAQFDREFKRHCAHNDLLEVFNIQQHASHYMSVCNVVREMVDSDENIIVLILFTFFSSLGWIIQTIFSEIYRNRFMDFKPNAIYQIVTGATYFIYLIMIIEPSHRVHEEMETTHRFVCKSMHCPNLSVKLCNELKAFKLLLELNRPTYSPLLLCTLARPLFSKIIGAFITYGVSIVQLSDELF